MSDVTVRTLAEDEHELATHLVGTQMLGSVGPAIDQGWADLMRGQCSVWHGSFDGPELVGVAVWFPTDLSLPGEPVSSAGVTGVAVRSTHRRQGRLRGLMEAQLRDAADAGNPTAILTASEFPIYSRFGYGFATQGCDIRFDTTARLRSTPTGTITMVDPAELVEPLEAMYEARRARTPGGLRRPREHWEHEAGTRSYPGRDRDLGKRRGALWHDSAGQLQGAMAFAIEERWTHHRPDGTAEVDHLYGATPEAERELWRFLTTLDWVRTATVTGRAVDDPITFWLVDGRAATLLAPEDCVWLRILDLPTTFGARRAPVEGRAVFEVADPMGYANGRWAVELGPDGGSATATTEAADVALDVSALGSAFLGGHTLARLAAAGLVDDLGGLGPASALLQTSTAPWCPIEF
jgi:predicted acetyltransferase